MLKFIVLVSLWALCQTAPHPLNENVPTLQPEPTLLPRPSPINPDIPSDPKPEEKITLINDKEKAQPQEQPSELIKPPQKRETQKDAMSHDDCPKLNHKSNQKDEIPKATDDKEIGIIKRETAKPENTQEGKEAKNKPNHHCGDEGCDHSEDHGPSKREADISRTTEAPGVTPKGKSKPYVATKPETFTQMAKREVDKVPEIPTYQPQPEQPDEGDNKTTPKVDVIKREISDPLTVDKTRDPDSESEDRKTSL